MSQLQTNKSKGKVATPAQKMARYRARLRADGLRPVQLWVPDTALANFPQKARKQSLLVSRSPKEDRDIDFIERVQEHNLDLPAA